MIHYFRTLVQTRKRIRQRATRYSLLVVVLLFGLFLEAYMHNFNLVYMMLFLFLLQHSVRGLLGSSISDSFRQLSIIQDDSLQGRRGAVFFASPILLRPGLGDPTAL